MEEKIKFEQLREFYTDNSVFKNIEQKEDDDLHYDRLDLIKEYLVETKDYCWLEIGDNTDYIIKDNNFIVDIEIISYEGEQK